MLEQGSIPRLLDLIRGCAVARVIAIGVSRLRRRGLRSVGMVAPVLACLSVLPVIGTSAGQASADAPGTGHTTHTANTPPSQQGPPIQLLEGSTFWVNPSSLTYTVHFALSGVSGQAQLGVEATVYSPLTTRSAFDVTKRGSTDSSALSSSSQIVPLAAIGGSAGGYELTLAVNSGDGTPPQEPASIDLQCSMGLCAGVYPLEIRVVPLGSSTSGPSNGGSSSTSRASLLTYLVYSYPSTQKLDFAWTLPLGVASALGGPVGSRSALDQSSLYQFANETSAVAGIPSVPLTLEPVPEIVAQLHASTQAKDRQALQSLEALAVTPGHEILSQSFVPVDASALTDAGLGGELSYQTRRALQILQTFHPDEHEWVSDSTLDPAAVTAISQQSSGGTRDVVVPPSAVTGGGCGVFTCTQPFDLASGNGTSVEAALSDPGLEADLPVAGSGDPALAAHRLLAELALIFLEQPNADDQRAVVLATPASWQPDSVFIRQVLQGLDGSPNIEAVDLDQLFSSVPIGGNSSRDVQPSARRPAVGSTGSGHLAVREVKMMRARLIAFSSAVAPVVVAPLSDDLLASEANDLSANQQRSALYGVRSALDRQLGELKLTTASVRLTSGAARVPISVTKNTPYTVEGLLTVSSDKLVFGSTAGCTPTKPTNGGFTAVDCRMVLSRGSNAVYVDMRSRTAGNFVVSVDLVSPKGGLTLVDGNVSVRSLSTSDVAIALSIGAAVVLLAWWGRTLWRGRRRGRGAHVRGANGSPQ